MFKANKIMTKTVFVVYPDTPVIEAIRLLVKHSVSGMPVVDDKGLLKGIVSEKDLLHFAHDPSNPALTVSNLMTKEVISFEEESSVIDICNCLLKQQFRRVPITKNGKLVGIVSRRDILKRLLELKNININGSSVDGEDA